MAYLRGNVKASLIPSDGVPVHRRDKGGYFMAIESSVVFLPVTDIEQTTQFYRDVIGLSVVQEQVGGSCRIFDTGYGYLGFCQYQDKRPVLGGPKGVCLSFNCHDKADVDAQYQKYHSAGLASEPPGKVDPFPVYSFFMEDPDGYKVEFQKILSCQEAGEPE